jgi:hypothetical protein
VGLGCHRPRPSPEGLDGWVGEFRPRGHMRASTSPPRHAHRGRTWAPRPVSSSVPGAELVGARAPAAPRAGVAPAAARRAARLPWGAPAGRAGARRRSWLSEIRCLRVEISNLDSHESRHESRSAIRLRVDGGQSGAAPLRRASARLTRTNGRWSESTKGHRRSRRGGPWCARSVATNLREPPPVVAGIATELDAAFCWRHLVPSLTQAGQANAARDPSGPSTGAYAGRLDDRVGCEGRGHGCLGSRVEITYQSEAGVSTKS